MPVQFHRYDLPDEDELARLVGAATPHFAHQIRGRVQQYLDALPPDHPRAEELRGHVAHLIALGAEGETGGRASADLPSGPSLSGLSPEAGWDQAPS